MKENYACDFLNDILEKDSVYASLLLTFALDIESESVALTTAQDLGNFIIQTLASNNPLNINTPTLTVNCKKPLFSSYIVYIIIIIIKFLLR
jgi:hypothetical protein